MDKKSHYFKQVDLLVRLLPLVGEFPCFALKGGTAINLFYRDMPRLSVDIDLVYLPIAERDRSLEEITKNLRGLGESISRRILEAKIQYSFLRASEHIHRLIVELDRVIVKIELSPVLRGTVYEPTIMRITRKAEESFGFAEVSVLSFEDLFAGKIVAALDRQHPRDLFDIKGLIENEGINDKLKEAFIVYLISHNRRMNEILNPNMIDIVHTYETDFMGMTTRPIGLSELLETRSELIRIVRSLLNKQDIEFLVAFKEGHPDWSYFSVSHIRDLPAVRWKLHNLGLVDDLNRKEMIEKFKGLFAG